jgi:RNA-directed DNA polymerase
MNAKELIGLLNPKIQGWANHHRHVCATATFNYVDNAIYKAIWRWTFRHHSGKGRRWIRQKYFYQDKDRNWVFRAMIEKRGITVPLDLVKAAKTAIKRHIKIRAEATPFNPAYHCYLDKRISEREKGKKSRNKPRWWLCWWELLEPKNRTEKAGSLAWAL